MNRAFTWIDRDHFLIRNDELNWLKFSLQDDTLETITNVGEHFRLNAPTVSQDMTSIAFQVQARDLDSFNTRMAVWQFADLIESCLDEENGQYLMSRSGWYSSGRYFAFTVYDYVEADTNVYVFDTETANLANILSLNYAESNAVVIGWVENG